MDEVRDLLSQFLRVFLTTLSLQSTNRPSISVEEEITIDGCGSLLGHMAKIIQKNFCSPDPRRLLFHGDTHSETVHEDGIKTLSSRVFNLT